MMEQMPPHPLFPIMPNALRRALVNDNFHFASMAPDFLMTSMETMANAEGRLNTMEKMVHHVSTMLVEQLKPIALNAMRGMDEGEQVECMEFLSDIEPIKQMFSETMSRLASDTDTPCDSRNAASLSREAVEPSFKRLSSFCFAAAAALAALL